MPVPRLASAATTVLAIAAAITTACSTAPVAAPQPPAPQPAPPASPSPSPAVPADLAGDWLGDFVVDLGDGYTPGPCLGDAPDLCVLRDGVIVGNLELSEYPLDAEADDAARGRAEDFLRFFREDRAAGCSDFAFVADEIARVTIGGEDGVRTGFRLLDAEGRTVEQVINYFVVHDGVVFLVSVDAYAAEGGCLPPSDVSLQFEPDVLAEVARHLDGIVAATPLPAASLPR